MKSALKLIALAFGLVATSYLVAAAFLGFELLGISKDAKQLVSQIKAGGNVDAQHWLADAMNKRIASVTNDLNDPLWRPLVKHFSKDFHGESQLLQSLIAVSPEIAGSGRAKRYLIAVQNNAEARGTGGLIGAFAEIEIHSGKITILREGSNAQLQSLKKIPIAMSGEYMWHYGDDPAIWQNSNESAHFPYGAKIWLALWDKQFHEKLDGVIATDPIALSYALKTIGTVHLADAEAITADNVVEKTLSTAYSRFATDNAARKKYLVDVMKAVLDKIVEGNFSHLAFIRNLEQPLLDHRMLFYSAEDGTQKEIQPTLIGGALSELQDSQIRVSVINTSGNKLDYYIKRSISVVRSRCKKSQIVTVKVTVTNTLKSDAALTDYVKGRLDLHAPHGVNGSHGFQLNIYGPTGSEVTSALRNAELSRSPRLYTELNHPDAAFSIDLPKQASETVTVEFQGGSGALSLYSQPLVQPDFVQVKDSC